MTTPASASAVSDLEAPAIGRGRRRIVAAMSGGVDSAVAAALLKAEGHEVIGITLQLYDHGEATKKRGACCAGQDIHDARRVADHLGISHYVLDYEKRFEQAVIQSFADSYLSGETPIPCVTCNSQVKFKDLMDTARDLGADLLATGHYIARRDTANGPQLIRAADTQRDQSYFLFATTPEQLAMLCFPLGDLHKDQVRALATELKLPVAEKPDSQDICFVPAGRYTDVIKRLRPDASNAGGDIVHVDGRVLGRHAGIAHYTVGQRRGLNINASVDNAEPLFVVRLDAAKSLVIVGPRAHLSTTALAIRNVNWLSPERPAGAVEVHVKLRSTQQPRSATVHFTNGDYAIVELHGAEYGISAGQACVFYADGSDRAAVLGGGWIMSGEPSAARSIAERNERVAGGLNVDVGRQSGVLRF
jgi:tRNA-uridine 2-sulfurtransferase